MKNVDFEITVNNADKAVQEFNKVDDSINGIAQSADSDLIPSLGATKKALEQAASPTKELNVFLPLLKTNFLAIGSSLMMTGGVIWAVVELVKWFNTLKLTSDDVGKASAELTLKILNSKSAAEEWADALGKVNKQLREMTNEQLIQRKLALETSTTKYRMGFHGASLLGGESDEAKRYKSELKLIEEISQQIERRLIPDINNEANAYEKLLRQQEGLTLILHQTIAGTREQAQAKKNLAEVEKLLATYEADKPNKIEMIKKEKTNIDILTESYRRLIESIENVARITATSRGRAVGGFEMSPVSIPEKPSIGAELTDQEFYRMNEQWIEGIQGTLNIMRSEFNQAWEDIFGEANSMFEKMIMNWADVFANALSKGVAGFILDLIPGGGIISDFLGFGKASSGGGSQTIVLEVDKVPFAKVVLAANNRASKLRLS